MTTGKIGTDGRARSAVLLSLALGAALAALVALAGTAQQAQAASSDKIVFISNRTTGKGVNNPTGDNEIFKMSSNGTGLRQLTFNEVPDYAPTLSPDGKKIAYWSKGDQTSNPEGDDEIYVMNALDGSGNKNLSNTGAGVHEGAPEFAPDGQKIAYTSGGAQPSNPEGDTEVYVMNATDGSGKINLSNTGLDPNGFDIYDFAPEFAPDGQKVAYVSQGIQTSNPEGDFEIYTANAFDGSGQKNLSNTGEYVSEFDPDFSPNGQKIAYTSEGVQPSNPEGYSDVYVMNSLDGTGKTNLSNSGVDVYDSDPDFSPDGKKVAFMSEGTQTSNPEGDPEVYVMNALDGSGKMNLSNNNADIPDRYPDFSPDSKQVAYQSRYAQTSNPEGDLEVYIVNALDGSGQKNLTNNGFHDQFPEWGR